MMNSYAYSYTEEYTPPVRRRRRRRRRQSIWPVFTLAVVLAMLTGLAVRISVFGKIAHVEDGFDTTNGLTHALTLPDSVQLHSLTVPQGTPVEIGDLVTGLEGTGITAAFVGTPSDVYLGTQEVVLQFTTETGACTQTVTLTRFRLVNEVTTELGSDTVPGIRDFVPDANITAEFKGGSPDALPADICGRHVLTIVCDGREYPVTYVRSEAIPPVGVGLTVTAPVGSVPAPETLVGEIVDHSDVTVTYAETPVLSVVGEHTVTMVLTDTFGNTSQVDAVIIAEPSVDGPAFTGLDEMRIQVGSTISYKTGVTATDPQDGKLTFTVDPGDVDNKTVGTYTAYYTATDSDGNTLTVPRTIVIQDEAMAAVENYAKAALEKIITDDMTRDQMIYKIYLYTKSNVLFVGTSDKSSIVHAAYEGFSTGKGDCYTYYAMNVIFFDLLGIENLEVARVGGTSNHWWNLVLHEDGKYYHVDSCPKSIYLEGQTYFRLTDSDLDTYTNDAKVAAHRPNYYVYDKTLPEYQNIDIAS